jgi:hypothetical protein
MLAGFGSTNLKVREYLNGLDINGRTILMLIFLKKIVRETIYWFCPARDWERWWAVVNARVSSNAAVF